MLELVGTYYMLGHTSHNLWCLLKPSDRVYTDEQPEKIDYDVLFCWVRMYNHHSCLEFFSAFADTKDTALVSISQSSLTCGIGQHTRGDSDSIIDVRLLPPRNRQVRIADGPILNNPSRLGGLFLLAAKHKIFMAACLFAVTYLEGRTRNNSACFQVRWLLCLF